MLRLLRHIREWIAVLKEEGVKGHVWPMIKAVASGPVTYRVWRARMRYGCLRCPIYDRELRRCRSPMINGRRLGCGCYVVFLAMCRAPYPKGCWARQHGLEHLGWPSV